jgi:hypothetical protein
MEIKAALLINGFQVVAPNRAGQLKSTFKHADTPTRRHADTPTRRHAAPAEL